MDTVNLHDPQQLAETLGDRITRTLANAVKARGKATLVVSGGSTPKPLFQYISHQPIDWSKITVTLADERCVPAESEQSNARLVRENLLQHQAKAAKFMPLHNDSVAPDVSAKQADSSMGNLPKFDCVILGMGNDGHTASIFPEASGRDQALDLKNTANAMLIDPVTVTPLRITQTARRLLNTRWMVLHITGEEKARLLDQIANAPDPRKWPISFFLCQNEAPFSVYKNSSSEQESAP
jgi:6-phosphogluconolactonase